MSCETRRELFGENENTERVPRRTPGEIRGGLSKGIRGGASVRILKREKKLYKE